MKEGKVMKKITAFSKYNYYNNYNHLISSNYGWWRDRLPTAVKEKPNKWNREKKSKVSNQELF